MTEGSHPRVYDLLYPTPLPLKNIIAISISVELWRTEINKYRSTNALDRLDLHKKIPIDGATLNIPSTTVKLIEEYSSKVGSSIGDWLNYNFRWIFKYGHDDHNHVLRDFDDFVCDFDGKIDEVKTARRVIRCDRFSDVEKFIIACKYCFEEDVARLWPSVSSQINFVDFDYHLYSSLHYWADRFRLKTRNMDDIWGEALLKNMNVNTCTTIEYFWNAVDSASHVEVAIEKFDLMLFSADRFCRYILPRLNDQELDSFMQARGDDLIPSLLEYPYWKPLILPVWRLVKDKITKKGFVSIVRKIFEKQTNYSRLTSDASGCCEIWNTASDELKRIAIRDVLQDDSLFVPEGYSAGRLVEFLLTVLSDATVEERTTFWNKNWANLIRGTSTKGLRDLMNLCIGDPDEIDKFRRTQLMNYEVIGPCCSQFLSRGDFQKLNEFIQFCCQQEQLEKEIKSRLLYEEFELNYAQVIKAKMLDEFIKSAFDDEDEIAEFKEDLSWTLANNSDLRLGVILGNYSRVMEFVDTMVTSQEVAAELKEHHLPELICTYFSNDPPSIHKFSGDELSRFLWWCFAGDEEKIVQFKQTLPIEKIVRCVADEMMKKIDDPHERNCRNYDLDALLEWYFTSPESLAEFKTSLADVFEKIGHN